jgi:hypothetical protein
MADDDDDERRPRRRRRDDDYDDDPPRRRGGEDDGDWGPPPRFPTSVKVAGVVWIGIGIIAFFNMFLVLGIAGMQGDKPAPGAQRAANQPDPNAANTGGMYCGACFSGFVALAFFYCGLQTVNGKAGDTLGNGAGSIILGILYGAGNASIVLLVPRGKVTDLMWVQVIAA